MHWGINLSKDMNEICGKIDKFRSSEFCSTLSMRSTFLDRDRKRILLAGM